MLQPAFHARGSLSFCLARCSVALLRHEPEHGRGAMLLAFGYKCAWCNFASTVLLEICSLEPIQEGNEMDLTNLIVLCPNCHKLFGQGAIPPEPLRLMREHVLMRNAEKAQFSDLLPKRRPPKKRNKRWECTSRLEKGYFDTKDFSGIGWGLIYRIPSTVLAIHVLFTYSNSYCPFF